MEKVETMNLAAIEEQEKGGLNIRSFRKSSDVEALYRYVHDNDLRKEAKLIFENIFKSFSTKKGRRKKNSLQ